MVLPVITQGICGVHDTSRHTAVLGHLLYLRGSGQEGIIQISLSMHSMHQIKSTSKSTFESLHNLPESVDDTPPFLQLRLSWWSQGDHAHSPSAHSVWAETVNSAMDQVSISLPERSSTIHSISSRTPAKHQLFPLQFNNPNTTQQSFVEEVTIWKSSPKTS